MLIVGACSSCRFVRLVRDFYARVTLRYIIFQFSVNFLVAASVLFQFCTVLFEFLRVSLRFSGSEEYL